MLSFAAMTPKEDEEFDHGGFWDTYSKRWEKFGDGEGRKFAGKDAVLGIEWGDDAHARRILERFVLPHLPKEARILEIGPGGGKWSRLLEQFVAELILADIAPKMLDRASAACRRKPRTIVLDGESLNPLADATLDMVFSFDVFIHLESEEIFRYFAEINRCLKPGSIFVVHTSNFDSRYGFLSYFRQIRDHRTLIGKRYGGRMYPMSPEILKRFAINSGFEVVEASHDFEDRDIVLALRKVQPAYVWQALRVPAIYEALELYDRMGGSDDCSLFAAHDRKAGHLRNLLVAAPQHPRLLGAAAAVVPDHTALAAPIKSETFAAFGTVHYPYLRGVNLARLLAGEKIAVAHPRPFWHMILEVILGLDRAHLSGLVSAKPRPDAAPRSMPSTALSNSSWRT